MINKIVINLQTLDKLDRKKNVEIAELVMGIPTRTWSSKSASIQRRTDRFEFRDRKMGVQVTNRSRPARNQSSCNTGEDLPRRRADAQVRLRYDRQDGSDRLRP